MARRTGKRNITFEDVQYVVQELEHGQSASVEVKVTMGSGWIFVELEVHWQAVGEWVCPSQRMQYRVLYREASKLCDGIYKRLWACIGAYNREILLAGAVPPTNIGAQFQE